MTTLNSAAAPLRGTILRDTQLGPGLISVAGRQFSFTLEQHWRSERPPLTGAAVEVLLDGEQVAQLCLVDSAQAAKETASQAADGLARHGRQLWHKAVAELGLAPLLTLLGLWLGWWVFDWVAVRVMGSHVASYSFWDMVKMLSAPNALEAMQYQQGGVGFWSLILLLCACAPLLPLLWRDRRASWGLAMPLFFMMVQGGRLYWAIKSAASALQQQMGGGAGRMMQELSNELQVQIFKSISLGFGLYLSVASALALAVLALMRTRR
jgi:hypothetical protein